MTLSGLKKSFIAEPSLKNSGLEATVINSSFLYFLIIFLIFFAVPTGTVDLVTKTIFLFTLRQICSTALNTNFKSA